MQQITIGIITLAVKILIGLAIFAAVIFFIILLLCTFILQKGSDSFMYIDLEDDREQMEALKKQAEELQRRKEAKANAREVRKRLRREAIHRILHGVQKDNKKDGGGRKA